MEYIDGHHLRGPMAVEEAVRLAIEIASALAEAHSRGILHRDLKPSNIVLTNKGAAKLVDFGLAKLVTEDPEATRTMDGRILGTPACMSPEQARSETLDARSDLFSLGAVLFECLTGRRAFTGVSSVGTLLEVVATEPPAPSSIAAAVPAPLDAIVRKLLVKDREARYASAEEVIADLQACQGAAGAVAQGAAGAVRNRRALSPVGGCGRRRDVGPVGRGGDGFGRHADEMDWCEGAMPRQVVVLPFENLSPQPEGVAFGDGLAEVVTGLLTRRDIFPDTLWIVPSSDVHRFGVQTVADAGRTFRANLAIGGSVQRLPQEAGWLITIAASDAVQPLFAAAERTIQLADGDARELEPRLHCCTGGTAGRPPACPGADWQARGASLELRRLCGGAGTPAAL